MNTTAFSQRTLFVITAIFIGAFTRLIPHPAGITAVGALTMFGGAYFTRRWMTILIPVLATFVSDVVLNNTIYLSTFKQFTLFYPGAEWVYGAVIMMSLVNAGIFRRITIANFLLSSIVTAMLFFLVSNFGVWTSGTLYPMTTAGLINCYVAALPYAIGPLLGNLIYGAVLFGGFHLAARRFPKLAYIK